jgi:hypothetical protein
LPSVDVFIEGVNVGERVLFGWNKKAVQGGNA